MKRLFTFIWLVSSIIALTCMIAFGQLPYTWYPANPSWTSSNSTDSTLDYQSTYALVSTSDTNTVLGGWYSYKNSQITTYTSPTYDFSCTSNIKIDIGLVVNLENRYDWMYFQYSTDGGANWINPVALNTQTNGSGVNLSAYPPLTISGTNRNRKGWTGQVGVVNVSYTVLASATFKMRFIFETDASINTYNSGANIYFCDITSLSVVCLATLPIELIGTPIIQCNGSSRTISWTTASESNTLHYVLQSSTEGMLWSNIATIDAAGWSNTPLTYTYTDNIDYGNVVYYQILEVDYNGYQKLFGVYYSLCETTTGIVEVYPNPSIEGEPIKIESKTDILTVNVYDLLGREIKSIYSNGILTGLSSGAYIVNINGSRIIKVIVK